MATTSTSFTGNYAGEKAVGYLAPAILAANTIANGGVTVHDNIRYKLNVRNLATTGFLANASCDFVGTGNVNLSDVVLEPKELQMNIELCKKDFQSQWEALEMRGRLLDQEIPSSFEDFFINHILTLLAKDVETYMWTGTASSGQFAGFQSLLAADSSVVDVVGTTITVANVFAEIAKVVDAIPNAVYTQDDFRIYIPIKTAKLFQRALGYGQLTSTPNYINSYNNQLVVGSKPLDFEGIPLFVANGLAENKMVAARTSDLHFGTNVMTDMNEVRIIDMAQYDGSQNVRFVTRLTAGTQITNGSNIVYYA